MDVLCYLILLLLIAPTRCSIFKAHVSESGRPTKHLGSFGFLGYPHSNFSLIIRQLSLSTVDDRSDPAGFALELRDSKVDARHRQFRGMGDCFLTESSAHRLLAIIAGTVPPSENVVWLRPQLLTESPQVIDWSSQLLPPGLYSLYFFDCSPGRRHSFDIDVHEYNSQPDGTRLYLPVGDQPLPALHWTAAAAMAVGAWWWRRAMVAHRPQLKALHAVMFVVVVLTVVSLCAAAAYYTVLNHTGRVGMTMAAMYHVPNAFARILTLLTITLLGIGWSLGARPLLRGQKALLLGVSLSAAVSSVLWAWSTELSEGHGQWEAMRRWWRLLGGLASLLAVYPLIRRIYRSVAARLTVACCYCCCPPCTAVFMCLQKGMLESEMQHHSWVCVAVMGFSFLGTVGVVTESLVPYDKAWLGPLIGLIAQFGLYATLANLFHPGGERASTAPVNAGVGDDDDLLLSGDEEGWPSPGPPALPSIDCSQPDDTALPPDIPLTHVAEPPITLAAARHPENV
eukprot:EG_transcript_9639